MNQLQTLYFDSIRNLPHETLDPTESTDMGMANIETKTTDMVYMAKLEYIGHDPLKLYKSFVFFCRWSTSLFSSEPFT